MKYKILWWALFWGYAAGASPLDYLFALRRAMPALFREAPAHNVDLIHLAHQREILRATFGENPRDYVTIEIQNVEVRTIHESSIDAKSLAELRQRLGDAQRRLGNRAALLSEIQSRSAALGLRNAEQVSQNLILARPAEQRPELWRLDVAERLRRLAGPADVTIMRQTELVDLLRLALLQDEGGAAVESLSEKDLDVFKDNDLFDRRFGRLKNQLGASRRERRDLTNFFNGPEAGDPPPGGKFSGARGASH